MLKILVLFLVLALVGAQESNTTNAPNFDDELTWIEGTAVNITVGPEDAMYCKLDNSWQINVFEGFGPCRLNLDRVTQEHRGYWRIWYANPGMVAVQNSDIFVNVQRADVDTTPRITSNLTRQGSTVSMTCTVPNATEVVSCSFRDPVGHSYMASPRELQDSRFRSFADRNNCTLQLLQPAREVHGIWRCAVQTTQDIRYSFIDVSEQILSDGVTQDWENWAQLRAKHTVVSGMEGQETNLFCYIPAVVRYCYYISPSGTVINLRPSTSTSDYEYVGNGFEAGECGIRIKNLRPSDSGDWSCHVGVVNSTEERRDQMNVYVNNRTMVVHRWQGNGVVVRLRTFPASELEYCRFVRNDGLGFSSDQVPFGYDFESNYGICELYIPRPQSVDVRPWIVVAKVAGSDEEISVKTTFEPRPPSVRGISSTTAVLLWSAFGTIFIFLIVVSFLPKKNREWTAQRANRIRNSFRRQPHHQHHVPHLPTQHISQPHQVDLPPKV